MGALNPWTVKPMIELLKLPLTLIVLFDRVVQLPAKSMKAAHVSEVTPKYGSIVSWR